MAEVSYYLCRLCAFKCLMPGTMVFSAEGLLNDIPRKIHECLQLTVCVASILSLSRSRYAINCFAFTTFRFLKTINSRKSFAAIVCTNWICRTNSKQKAWLRSIFWVVKIISFLADAFECFMSMMSFQNYSNTMCSAMISLRKTFYKIRNFNVLESTTNWRIRRPSKNWSILSMEHNCLPIAVTFQRWFNTMTVM